MPQPTIKLFSAAEFDERLRNVRTLMAKNELDVLLVHSPENIYYLTGYQTPGYYWHQVLILPVKSEPVFIPPPHEASLIPEYCWIDDVRLYPDTSDWAKTTADLLIDLGFAVSAIGLETESRYLSVNLRDRLVERLSGAHFQNGNGMIESCRLIKSQSEQNYMREAARMSELGMQAGIDAVRNGATEIEVAAAVHSALDLAGSEYTGLPAFITSGERTQMVHATWSPKRINSGELVFWKFPEVRIGITPLTHEACSLERFQTIFNERATFPLQR